MPFSFLHFLFLSSFLLWEICFPGTGRPALSFPEAVSEPVGSYCEISKFCDTIKTYFS
ncbi:hypothetical protein BACCOPRO_00663 [Phocaeicola coprophilus DSM 18228 = JCM 13818]|uniref:Uncharacterized protein n=1 Tax=Phocaeicola coprophilus DSM 18228 = JCM 13818 TaxID=547042 RepID=S0F5J7_9BACT|nr:hypothetical protein BACCOPRO_00663 [Phocaeicola coprophilus DSM 18228 = JCM 13818]